MPVIEPKYLPTMIFRSGKITRKTICSYWNYNRSTGARSGSAVDHSARWSAASPVTRRSLFRNSLSGSESNRVVKEWCLLTRESESSKGLLPGCEPNLHGCSRTPRATVAELEFRCSDPNRRKPAKTGLEMQKAESLQSRLSVLTG
jgi:hypothetical protein